MPDNSNEIKFLLDFDFQSAGAKEAEEWLTKFIAYFGDFNEIAGASAPVMQRYTERLQEVVAVTKKLSDATATETGISKESMIAMQLAYNEAKHCQKGIEDLIQAKKNLTKTTEELKGEISTASREVTNLSGKLLKMKADASGTKEDVQALTTKLNMWKNTLIELKEEMVSTGTVQKELGGIITQTKNQIVELTAQLDKFTTVEELASEEAMVYIKQIAILNETLRKLQTETSGVLTIENALNKTREVNIKMANQIAALDQVDVRTKAELSAGTKELNSQVKALNASQELDLKLQEAEAALAPELLQKEARLNSLKEKRALILKELKAQEEGYGNSLQESGRKQEESGSKSIWTLDNIIKKIDFMGVRMLATMFWWGLVIGSATALYEMWTKIDDATKLANDRLKSYFDNFKNLQKEKLDIIPQTQASVDTDQARSDILIGEMKNNADPEKRFAAYKELQSMYRLIFDDMTKEQFLQKEGSSRMQEMINTRTEYIKVLKEEAAQSKLLEDANKSYYENIDQRNTLQKKIVKDVREGTIEGIKFWDLTGKRSSKLSDKQIIDELQKHVSGTKDDDVNMVESAQSQLVIDTKRLNAITQAQKGLAKDAGEAQANLAIATHRKINLEGNYKDPKAKQGRAPRDLEEARATEKSLNEGKIIDINNEYDASPRSDLDKAQKYAALDAQAKEHYKRMGEIITQFADKTRDSKEKLKKYRSDDANDFKKTNEEIQKAGNADLMESQRYNEAKLKQIKDTNETLQRISDEYKNSEDKAAKQQKGADDSKRKFSRFNPFQAFFKGGADNPNEDRKDKYAELDLNIDNTRAEAARAETKYYKATLAANESSDKVAANDKIENPGELQKQQFANDREVNEKNQKELESAQKEFDERKAAAKIAISDKVNAQLADKQKDEIKIAEATFDATTKIANAAFDAQKKRIENQMNNLRSYYALENTLAGNNSAAKIRIAVEEHGKILALKREEAKAQKAQSLFNAVTNTAVGFTQALAQGGIAGIILGAIVAAAGLVEISEISSQPLPSYAKGRRGGKREKARINEEGYEIVESKSGEKKIFGGGKETFALLEEGDTVHTHTESNKWMKDLLKGTGVYMNKDNERIKIISQSITKSEVKEAFSEALKDMPQPTIIMPARGVEDRLRRTQARNGL